MTAQLATRHHCIHRSNPDVPGIHTQGTGKPTRRRCGYCGGDLITERGRYHLFEHRGDGRYIGADSLADFLTQAAADRRADELNRGEYLESYNSHHGVVVRWEVYEPCSECGNLAAYLLAWQHRRLCPVCREFYEYRLGLWRAAQPVTVGRGVTTPGHVVEVPSPSLELLGSVAITECPFRSCRAQPGELHGKHCPEGGEIRNDY